MRRLGRETRGFPSVDEVMSNLEDYSKLYGVGDLSRPNTPQTGKYVTRLGSGRGIRHQVSAVMPTFEGSLSVPEWDVLLDDPNLFDKRTYRVKPGPLQHHINTISGVPHGVEVDRDFANNVTDTVNDSEKGHKWDGSHQDIIRKVNTTVRETPGFSESLQQVRAHLRSPQLSSALETRYRNRPEDRPGGRFVDVGHFTEDAGHVKDVLDLKTQNWVEMHPDTWFPDR